MFNSFKTILPICLTLILSSSAFADNETYTVGTIRVFPPFTRTNEVGIPEGFDIDLINAIAAKENFNVNFKVQLWRGLLEKLNTGDVDIVATAVVITPERQEKYDFSHPYLDTGWMAVLKENNQGQQYQTFEEAIANSNNFVTETDGAGEKEVKNIIAEKSNGKLKTVNSTYLGIKDIATSQSDISYDISRVLQYYVYTEQMNKRYNLYGLVNPNAKKDHFGFVVKKGRKDLLEKLNRGLKTVHYDGTYDNIYKKWFKE
ncbi:transporter substrate-binding domain-containing protein [Suttonella ornithocola]|uniref:Glutamine-binding periplasmic protein n=1 Tax=Suttonella ornithocola TaxID=279832 RepID=A0A380MMN2_9GAMM|nr:transporter substrate-binding domain-containing protein [Suttonella ornithocola]SUO93316.1 Glutamine-binding periplasmic protein precursor [Suttonella ornithocola]